MLCIMPILQAKNIIMTFGMEKITTHVHNVLKTAILSPIMALLTKKVQVLIVSEASTNNLEGE